MNHAAADTLSIIWNPPAIKGKCGIRNLKLGDNRISLTAEEGTFYIDTLCDINLTICGKNHHLTAENHKSMDIDSSK